MVITDRLRKFVHWDKLNELNAIKRVGSNALGEGLKRTDSTVQELRDMSGCHLRKGLSRLGGGLPFAILQKAEEDQHRCREHQKRDGRGEEGARTSQMRRGAAGA